MRQEFVAVVGVTLGTCQLSDMSQGLGHNARSLETPERPAGQLICSKVYNKVTSASVSTYEGRNWKGARLSRPHSYEMQTKWNRLWLTLPIHNQNIRFDNEIEISYYDNIKAR